MNWKKLLFLPPWLVAALTVVSGAGLAFVFGTGREETVLAYGIYALSFYALTVLVIFCAFKLPGLLQRAKSHPVTRKLSDRSFRMYLSLAVSLLYVGVNLLSWYFARSWWFVVLAVYYVIMTVLRFLTASYAGKHKLGENREAEWRRARLCAWLLLPVNLSLSGAVLMILYRSKGFDYPGFLIYVMALFTFCSVIHGVVELVKNRKLGSPVMTAANAVSLSGALVSLLNLETAMFAQFGGELAPEHQRMFIILTGAGVSVAIVTLSVLTIVRASKEIKNG